LSCRGHSMRGRARADAQSEHSNQHDNIPTKAMASFVKLDWIGSVSAGLTGPYTKDVQTVALCAACRIIRCCLRPALRNLNFAKRKLAFDARHGRCVSRRPSMRLSAKRLHLRRRSGVVGCRVSQVLPRRHRPLDPSFPQHPPRSCRCRPRWTTVTRRAWRFALAQEGAIGIVHKKPHAEAASGRDGWRVSSATNRACCATDHRGLRPTTPVRGGDELVAPARLARLSVAGRAGRQDPWSAIVKSRPAVSSRGSTCGQRDNDAARAAHHG